VQASATTEASDFTQMLEDLEHGFTGVFVLEIVLRMLSDGWTWIANTGNAADTMLILTTGVLPLWILKPAGVRSDAMRAFAVLRVLRLIRLVRLVRTVPMLRILWSLIQGVLDSGRLWLFTLLLIGVTIYILSIFCIYALANSPELETDETTQDLFQNVPRGAFTLFQFLTLDSWAEPVRSMMKKNPLVTPTVIVSIMTLTLVLANLVTAVIVNNAFGRAQADQYLAVLQKREEMNRQVDEMAKLFEDIDEDHSGSLSAQEYFTALKSNSQVQDLMTLLDIEETEHEEIWRLICYSNDEARLEDFISVLRTLRGEASAKDVFTNLRRLLRANRELDRIAQRIKDGVDCMVFLQAEATAVRIQLGQLLTDVAEFVRTVEPCIPLVPVEASEDQIKEADDKICRKLEALS